MSADLGLPCLRRAASSVAQSKVRFKFNSADLATDLDQEFVEELNELGMEKIRILFYTDYAPISNDKHRMGLTDLKRFIELKISGLVNVRIDIRNRHYDYKKNTPVNGATPLTSTFLKDYEELWIFGYRPKKTKTEPHNELAQEEVDALLEWMKTGGVMITGDHSEPADDDDGGDCGGDHKKFINLGAAIGRRIPRAGDLRVWDGPPTNCHGGELKDRDNHNTQTGDDPKALDHSTLQYDRAPQTLRLLPADPPHRLFWYVDPKQHAIVPITKFPDHMHEGGLKVPSDLGDLWPKTIDPPVVVAQSRDNRFAERYYDTVVAYDGDPRVGRIVADSSFHHFVNKNLGGLDGRLSNSNKDPKPGTDLDQIAQFYGNLALWLAPKTIRDQIIERLFFEAARHPDVLEEKGNTAQILGRTALDVLNQDIGPSSLYQLLAPSSMERKERELEDIMSAIFLSDDFRFGLTLQPEKILGCVIQDYHDFFDEAGITDPGWLQSDPAPTVALNGLRKAFQGQPELLREFEVSSEAVKLTFQEDTEKKREAMEMANLKCGDDWSSEIGTNHDDDGVFVLSVVESSGEITGYHEHPDGNRYPVWGLCRHGTFSGHRIDVWEPVVKDGKCVSAYHYFGKIKLVKDDDRKTDKGKRRKLLAITDKAAKKFTDGDDDWIGTHTT